MIDLQEYIYSSIADGYVLMKFSFQACYIAKFIRK